MSFDLCASRLISSVMAGLVLATASAPLASAPAVAAGLADGATLTVLSNPVEVASASGGDFVAAAQGQTLTAGDVVRTGAGGVALVTFFDGSESQVGSNAQVQIERAESTPAPQIAFLQSAGVTVNHVVPLPDGGSFRTDTPTLAGLVRGTSYVVVVGSDSDSDSEADASASVPGATSASGEATDQQDAVSVILLTDRDGHVGHVDVAMPDAEAPAVELRSAGAAAAARADAVTAVQMDDLIRQPLEAQANQAVSLDGTIQAEAEARRVSRLLRQVARQAGPAVGEAPTLSFGEDGKPFLHRRDDDSSITSRGSLDRPPAAAEKATPQADDQKSSTSDEHEARKDQEPSPPARIEQRDSSKSGQPNPVTAAPAPASASSRGGSSGSGGPSSTARAAAQSGSAKGEQAASTSTASGSKGGSAAPSSSSSAPKASAPQPKSSSEQPKPTATASKSK